MKYIPSDSAADAHPAGPALVMLDWDGVLADSRDVFTSIFLEACLRCGVHGLDAPGRLMTLFDGNLYAVMQTLGLQRDRIGRILEHFKRETLSRLDEIRLFAGVRAALEAIAESHIVSIVTSNLCEVPRRVLAREGIACVGEILGVEMGTSKVEKIRNSRSRQPLLPAYYVGDTKGDMLEGKAAGATTIAATWGWHGEDRLGEGNPDFLVRSPDELAEFFAPHRSGIAAGGGPGGH